MGPIPPTSPYVAFSLKVTHGNVGRANKLFACGRLSSMLEQFVLKLGPA